MIKDADDIIAALRSIIADYEQRLSGPAALDKAAPVPPAPQTPAGAATPSIEDRARKMALKGRQAFLDWYAKLDDDQRKRLQAIAGEIKALFPEPAAIAKAKGGT